MYAKIVFAIPVNNFYYYLIPDKLVDRIECGQRVKVNFNNRNTYGYVIEKTKKLDKEIAPEDIKVIRDIIDDKPLFNSKIFDLALWISSYYLASLGESLKLMTPGGMRIREYQFDKPVGNKKKVILTEKQDEIFKALKQLDLPDYALIYGITGSGKTEIYLSLIEYFIKKKSKLSIWFLRYRLPNNFFQN